MVSVLNYRELGNGMKNREGKRIKAHMIYRSGHLDLISEDDLKVLIGRGINHVYDLRSPNERRQISLCDIEVFSFDIGKSDTSLKFDRDSLTKIAPNAYQFMKTIYQDYLPFSQAMKPLFQQIIREREPFLFHCAQGKDRTGVVAAILLSILGFSEEDIFADFMIIDQRVVAHAEENQRRNGFDEKTITDLRYMNGINPDYMRAYIETINRKFGSLQSYVTQELGITKDQIAAFKHRYLT